MVTMLVGLLGFVLCQDALAFYNSTTGRWLTRDPITEVGFNLTREPQSTDPEMEHLLQVGLRSLRNRDRAAFSTWLEELSTRQETHQRPYHSADFVGGGRESVNPYVFNLNDGIDQIDCFGLISFTVTHPCVNPCCKYWLFCQIKVDRQDRFPRHPFLLAGCLHAAINVMNGACALCNYAGYEAGCANATACFDIFW